MGKPLAIDLYAGLGGWTDGLLAEGYDVVGFDIEEHVYGDARYPAKLVVRDVLTIHGSEFKDAALIVASPPCQEYSYMAMPWTRAKAKAKAIRDDTTGQKLADLNRLFNACFRIQLEASIAAGRKVPMIVENVKGAQPWVGRARWNFGSFFLWGDVPALMPHRKEHGTKNAGGSWFAIAHNTESGKSRNPVEALAREGGGVKHHGSGAAWFDTGPAAFPSGSPRRKAASALIAKIPLPLSRHIAATYR